ncbi:MAG: carbohydrate ABC transporter permease [Treponemataceae bacterium]|mgnify:CR=1 FL=1|uniref:carbohydrate ABC transporter permease n=1 Tax=Treponema sp. J25 TaxID=2094121 RepID=UPI001FB6DE52|nr:carbohydrate ABC transporter permease [Treponema sp. J25]MCX7949579.1 carbohydrate ABC transporter permease [Treponemataceae bacterium]HOK00072.1 carbohydrate ABC transporter permease [Termitinemataceae bacterium]HOM24067.1 carbohydrate ABC transporter permease [Termitinemataceae bacterium]HPQ01373.1 carbohydrate ABC transporter permease [Termitinemataceae bacterium]
MKSGSIHHHASLHRQLLREKVAERILELVMVLVCFITLYPVWYTVVLSFNESADTMLGGIYWWPRKFTLESYKTVFLDKNIIKAFNVTIWRTLIGTITSVFFTSMVAYAFSKRYLVGQKFYMLLGTITMFFGGGLIPYFILLKSIGLYDTFWVYIIPGLFSFWNMLIFVSFFRELPAALEESARIDGANDFVIFLRIVLPVSMPVLATIALFNGVYNWNDYFMGVIFINNPDLQPIQTFLYRVVASATASRAVVAMPVGISAGQVNSQSVQMATMVVTTAPIIVIYPFLQKYFVKGIMIGSIKG